MRPYKLIELTNTKEFNKKDFNRKKLSWLINNLNFIIHDLEGYT